MTREYWYGFANSTKTFDYNKGYAEGSSNMTQDWNYALKSADYDKGYKDGKFNASPSCDTDCSPSVLPNDTKDNYMQFYIGYYNGAVANDFDYDHNQGQSGLAPELHVLFTMGREEPLWWWLAH